jgi:hypothetical protein
VRLTNSLTFSVLMDSEGIQVQNVYMLRPLEQLIEDYKRSEVGGLLF